MNIYLSKLEPTNSDNYKEWKDWSLKLKEEITKLEQTVQDFKKKEKNHLKDIQEKEVSIKKYKELNDSLTNTIKNIKSNSAYKLAKVIILINRYFIRFIKSLHLKKK